MKTERTERPFQDLTGNRFGELTVLGLAERHNAGHIAWQCRCDCGAVCVVLGVRLRHGRTKSCGHLRKGFI